MRGGSRRVVRVLWTLKIRGKRTLAGDTVGLLACEVQAGCWAADSSACGLLSAQPSAPRPGAFGQGRSASAHLDTSPCGGLAGLASACTLRPASSPRPGPAASLLRLVDLLRVRESPGFSPSPGAWLQSHRFEYAVGACSRLLSHRFPMNSVAVRDKGSVGQKDHPPREQVGVVWKAWGPGTGLGMPCPMREAA